MAFHPRVPSQEGWKVSIRPLNMPQDLMGRPLG